MNILKLIKHKILISYSLLRVRPNTLDYWAESVNSISARWDGEKDPVITYTAMFDILRQQGFSGSFWEFGGGYSTILAPILLKRDLNTINSVDFNPDKYNRILNSVRLKRSFCASINLLAEITVSLEEVERSIDAVADEICAKPKLEVLDALSVFVSEDHLPSEDINLKEWIVQSFVKHPHYNEELGFYKSFDALVGDKLCSSLVAKNTKIDALFLDCGEISSIAEFHILIERLTAGSFILLHDIFYPKSIKNYLVGTALVLDESWELLYIDKVSAQGGCVFQKVG